MTYTDDQSKALDAMSKWAKEGDSLLYTLNGGAGTGKTTITKAFINSLNIPRNRIAVTAPTHKAKKVIQNATNFPAETIQKLLGLRPDVELDRFDPNNPVFNAIGEDTIGYYKIVIIDESSMINKEAFNLLVKKSKQYNVKLLFLGDAYQLPPVNEVISKVFSEVEHKSTLSQVVRQEDTNPMAEMLKIIREDVKNKTNFGISKMIQMGESIYNNTGFRCLSNEKVGNIPLFGDAMMEYYYSSIYEVDKDYIKILSYTNKSIEKWSIAIRKKLLKEDADKLINVGELLTGYNTIQGGRGDIVIQNSSDYIITGITRNVSEFGIEGFSTTMESETGAIRNVFIVDTTNDINRNLFIQHYNEKVNIAKAKKGGYWRAFYTFKNFHLVLNDIYDNAGNFICKKDLYYGYGVTVHKSQGSTYGNVALNLTNIYTNRDVSERNRLVYVALSRAKDMNLILTK